MQLPTSSSIAAAKQKRHLIRRTGGEIGDDYVSLSLTKHVDQGPHPESRLVREEDELGEADDGENVFPGPVLQYLLAPQSLRNIPAPKNGLHLVRRDKKLKPRKGGRRWRA